jgi:hypothetical protein
MTIAHERIQSAPTIPTQEILVAEEVERTHLQQMVECARTQAEVQGATEALRAWVARHPEQANRLEGVFEYLYLTGESAREAQEEARAMGLSLEEIARREHVVALRRRVRAEDPADVFEPALRMAREALEGWQAEHPEDPQLPSLREALDTEAEVASMLQEAA